MQSNFDDVGDFHSKFDLDNVTHSRPGPRDWDDDLLAFRIKFLEEEFREFVEGVDLGDHAKMFDALIDLAYVAFGTAHLLGYPWQAGWNQVQAANMKKERAAADGSNSVRNSSFDVVKPPGWQPPDIAGVLRSWGFEV